MGRMCHHGIFVTCDVGDIDELHREIVSLVAWYSGDVVVAVSEVSPVATNGYRSFAIFPDGSKEGWKGSNSGDVVRDKVIAYLERYGSCDWVEVRYGDDTGNQRVIRASYLEGE